MPVITATTVRLEDRTGDHLIVEGRTPGAEHPDEVWCIAFNGSATVYATADDLREFAQAVLELVG